MTGGLRAATDDLLTLRPRTPNVRAYLREGVDRLVGADPGLTQLRTAVQAVLAIAAACGLAYAFVKGTGALQLSPGDAPPPVVAATNHALIIVAMLLAGIIAMMAGFTVNDATVRGQIVTTLLLPLPMLATLTLGLAIGRYRIPSLVFLVLVLIAAVYVRRWGPRGFAAGLVAFNGGFLGFFLHAEIPIRDVGWLTAVIVVGVLASLAVRLLLFRPDVERTLHRMRLSWEARARRLLLRSLAALDDDAARHRDTGDKDALHRSVTQEKLRRQVVRLNESTLMIDAQLADAVPRFAALEAQRLFDAELAISNIARFAGALGAVHAEPGLRRSAHAAVAAVLDGDWDMACAAAQTLRDYRGSTPRSTVLAHRLAASIAGYAQARQQLDAAITERLAGRDVADFAPAVTLNAGFLPGSVAVSALASTTPGRGGRLDRATMPPYVRTAIQIGVAATIAVVVGDLVSGFRLYWAVLATFLAFMATTNSAEQVRKALFRVAGTAIGIVLGDLLVHVTGGNVWAAFAIVLVTLFLGIYLIRVNYTFMAMGITVTLSLLYYQLGEFSWNLLLLRLGETAIGVGAVVVTVLVILPLRPQRVIISGVLLWLRALSGLLGASLERLVGEPGDAAEATLRPLVRQLDAAYAAFEATVVPLRRSTFGRNSAQLAEVRAVAAAVRNYARSLADAVERLEAVRNDALTRAAGTLRASLGAVDRRVETGDRATYVRISSLVEVARTQLGPAVAADGALDTALRDLTLLDGALARLAQALDMDVRDLDTTARAERPLTPA